MRIVAYGDIDRLFLALNGYVLPPMTTTIPTTTIPNPTATPSNAKTSIGL